MKVLIDTLKKKENKTEEVVKKSNEVLNKMERYHRYLLDIKIFRHFMIH